MILLDLANVPHDCADHALETLHKSIAESPGESAIWRRHENPFLADLVESFSARGTDAITFAQDALRAALGMAKPVAVLRKADGWSDEDAERLRERLNKPLGDYAPEDWLALVDLIFHTRMPDAFAGAESERMTALSALAGQLQAMHDWSGDPAREAELVGVMARAVRSRPVVPWPASPQQASAMAFARARIGLTLRGVTDATRARVSGTILAHVQEHGLARRGQLEQSLLDDFGTMNRDWRRVAITEAGEVANASYLAAQPEESRVRRIEAYEGACPFCRRIDGEVFTWSTTPRPNSDGWTHVWPGKTNVGRSASPRKRGMSGLEERTESELWWPAAGVMHPNCRGRWKSLPRHATPETADFAAWMERAIAEHEQESK